MNTIKHILRNICFAFVLFSLISGLGERIFFPDSFNFMDVLLVAFISAILYGTIEYFFQQTIVKQLKEKRKEEKL
jgi:hypothetical protein